MVTLVAGPNEGRNGRRLKCIAASIAILFVNLI